MTFFILKIIPNCLIWAKYKIFQWLWFTLNNQPTSECWGKNEDVSRQYWLSTHYSFSAFFFFNNRNPILFSLAICQLNTSFSRLQPVWVWPKWYIYGHENVNRSVLGRMVRKGVYFRIKWDRFSSHSPFTFGFPFPYYLPEGLYDAWECRHHVGTEDKSHIPKIADPTGGWRLKNRWHLRDPALVLDSCYMRKMNHFCKLVVYLPLTQC